MEDNNMEILRVVKLSEMTDSAPVSFAHNEVPYSIVKIRETVMAFISICSHAEKPFKPVIDRNCLICPFHDVRFDAFSGEVKDRNGKQVPSGLVPVKTAVRDGWVYLVAEDRHRMFFDESQVRRQQRRERKQRRRGLFDIFRWR
jgi:nitrite reductase/ring-hydroxylating ferredoxin subunit